MMCLFQDRFWSATTQEILSRTNAC